MWRTDGAHQHPNSTLVKKLAATLAGCGAAKYHYPKIVLPENIASLPVARGPRMSALGCGHSAVHLITFPAALRPITPGAACWRSTMRDCRAAEVANFLAIKHAARFNDKVRFYLG